MKRVISIQDRKESKSDFSYWKDVPYHKRIEAIEILRAQYLYLNKNVQQRLQRVYTITKRTSG